MKLPLFLCVIMCFIKAVAHHGNKHVNKNNNRDKVVNCDQKSPGLKAKYQLSEIFEGLPK